MSVEIAEPAPGEVGPPPQVQVKRSAKEVLNRYLPLISSVVMLVVFIGVWEFLVAVVGVSKFLLPSPLSVAGAIGDLFSDGEIWTDLRVTLTEIVVGFAIALVGGVMLGALLGKVRWLERATQPGMVAFQVVPKVALVPLFVIWFGFGMTSKIVIAAIIAFFPVTLNVLLGVRSVDRGHQDVMRGLGASRWATFRNLELPSTLPYVFAGAEVSIVFAVIGAIVGEYLGGSQGLGYLIVISLNQLDAPKLFATIVVLTALGTILFLAVSLTKRFVIPWHESIAT